VSCYLASFEDRADFAPHTQSMIWSSDAALGKILLLGDQILAIKEDGSGLRIWGTQNKGPSLPRYNDSRTPC
jgi:hypothetical protein